MNNSTPVTPLHTTSSVSSSAASSTTHLPILSTTLQPGEDRPKDGVIYLVAILSAVLFLILFVSVMLFYIRKKRLDKLRHQLMPFYTFDPHEEDGDWESDLLDDNSTGITKRIDYKSVEFFKSSAADSRRL